jgi:hypothetical protein
MNLTHLRDGVYTSLIVGLSVKSAIVLVPLLNAHPFTRGLSNPLLRYLRKKAEYNLNKYYSASEEQKTKILVEKTITTVVNIGVTNEIHSVMEHSTLPEYKEHK